MRLGIATKLVLLAIVLIVAAIVFLGWFFVRHETGAIKTELDKRANTILSNLAYNSEYGILAGDREAITRFLESVIRAKDVAYVIVEDKKGGIIAQAGEKEKEPIREFTASVITERLSGSEWELGFIPQEQEEGGETIGLVRLGISLSNMYRKGAQLRRSVLLTAIIVVLVSILSAFLGIRILITRPLMPLVSGMETIGRGDLSHRVEAKTGDEIGELAVLFNRMAEDLSKTLVSKDYVDNIIKTMMDTLIVVSPDGTIETVNQATLDLLGYSEDELIGEPLGMLFAGEDLLKTGLIKERAISNVEKTYLSKDGRRIPILLSSSVMEDKDGHVIHIVYTGVDITDRKRAEEVLAEERNLLRTMIDNVPDQIYVKDTKSRFAIANTSLVRLVGATSPEELTGKTDFDFFSQEVSAGYYDYEQEIMRSGQPVISKEESDIDSAGNKTWVLTTKVPLRDSSGKIIGLVGINRDITELKRAEEALQHRLEVEEHITAELEEKTKELSRSNEELNALLYTIAHDVKAHAASFQILSALLANDCGDGIDENGRAYIHRIRKNSEHMGALIEDILELSSIGKAKSQEQLVDMSALISDVADELAPELEKRGTRLIVRDGMPELRCDRARIRRVFANLMSNASKFMGESNENPTIEVGYDGQDGYHTFYVRDNGIGIDGEYHEKIFQILQRLGDIEAEGTGVGLTIVKKIVENFGGEIRVDSAKGKGTTMYFTMPKAEGHRRTD